MQRGTSFDPTSRRRGNGWIGLGETKLDMNRMQYLKNTFDDLESCQIARVALQARVFCEDFGVIVKGLNKSNISINSVTKMVIGESWMPTLPKVHNYKIMFGLCPYMWKRVPKSNHFYPVVPTWGTYIITYEDRRDGTRFFLYWTDEKGMPKKATNIFWEIDDTAPEGGRFRSIIATLSRMYDMQMINAGAIMSAVKEAANPFFVFEHNPKQANDLSEYIGVEEGFGSKEVFKQMGDKNEMQSYQANLARDRFQSSLMDGTMETMGFDMNPAANFSKWDGSMTSIYKESYNKVLARSIVLDADHKVQGAPTPTILMKMDEIWMKLSRDCASMIGFPLEFAQPMSATRSANVTGNIRFLNESVKKLRKDFRRIVRKMWLISYGSLIVDEVKNRNRSSVKQPSTKMAQQLNEQIEIEIEWPCIPEMTYEQLRQLVVDKVIDHSSMKCQAAGLIGMPASIISKKDGQLPEEYAIELQERQFKLQKEQFEFQSLMQKIKKKRNLMAISMELVVKIQQMIIYSHLALVPPQLM